MRKIKKSIALVVVLLLMSSNTNATQLDYVADCFTISFNSLWDFVDGLGFEPSIEFQTEYVNDAYAACECLLNDGFCLFD